MGGLLHFVGDWGHIVGAALFAALAIWVSRRFATERAGKLLVAALTLTSVWLLSIAAGGVERLESGIIESLRNCGWLACLFVLPSQFGQSALRQARGARPLYMVLALLLVAQTGLDILAGLAEAEGEAIAPVGEAAVVLRTLWAIGALLLVQRIFVACSKRVREMVAPVAAVMVAMWSYDLILYGAAFFGITGMILPLYALRGGVMAALAPVMAMTAITIRRDGAVQPSRALAWRGIGVVAGLILICLALLALRAIDEVASPALRAAITGGLFLLVAGGLLVMPMTHLHRRMKLFAAKHLFRHRYDYRERWMAFADTMGHGGDVGIYQRVVKAMADITESSGGALLMMEGGGRFSWHSDWNWRGEPPAEPDIGDELAERMRARAWVVDIAEERALGGSDLPPWLLNEGDAWALVPLIHFDELIGAILLGKPPVMRPLDWEDFDMLRTAGRQVASYIAEARGQHALAEARRFEEFNRRFAFIMHDIKNLVSQIALVARNAERHSDNPAFRADMILTLKDCANRMNGLLARLSQHHSRASPVACNFALGDVIRSVVAARGAAHPLLIEGDLGLTVEADRAGVEQIINHLVQNAIEASTDETPVVIRAERAGDALAIAVIDHGCGMTAEFIRDHLFRPFASTKNGGFGIGAFEAAELARALGGSIDVVSTPGKGSCFTLRLPTNAREAKPSSDTNERAA